MAFTGPYPTKFSGHTTAMVISATNFSGGVTNAGTIGTSGVTVISSTFLTGGFLNSNLISGAPTGIAVLSDSTIHGAIVDSGPDCCKPRRYFGQRRHRAQRYCDRQSWDDLRRQ